MQATISVAGWIAAMNAWLDSPAQSVRLERIELDRLTRLFQQMAAPERWDVACALGQASGPWGPYRGINSAVIEDELKKRRRARLLARKAV